MTRKKLPSEINFRNWMSTVRNQKKIGCCSVITVCTALEYLLRRKTGEKNIDLLSPSFVYYNLRQLGRRNPRKDSGATIEEAVHAIQEYGACKEKEWPFNKRELNQRPSTNAYKRAFEDIQHLQYHSLNPDLHEIRSILANGYVVNAGIHTYSSFHSSRTLDTGIVPMPKIKQESYKGGHAILIIGYNDEKKQFLFQNSWGTHVGRSGYFFLPYKYILDARLCCELLVITDIDQNEKAVD